MAFHEKFRFEDKIALREKIEELGLDIPFADDVSPLLEKPKVSGRELPNRLAVLPMEGADAGPEEGSPGELTFRRYRRFAAGGSGTIWFEATAVTEDGRSNPHQLMLTGGNLGVFKRLVEETRNAARTEWGASHDPLLILQLTHSGRFSKPLGKPAPVVCHRSPALDALQCLPGDHPLLSDGELERLQEKYVAAAALAAEAGFDGVDIKACHGYLVSELLASFTRGGSRYGGSLENRARFLREVFAAVRRRIPELIVTTRLNAYDSIPYPHGFGVDKETPSKVDLTEPKALIRELRTSGLELLAISAGIPYYKPFYGRPFDVPIRGAGIPDEHPLEGVSRLLAIAADLQAEFPGLAVVGSGYSWLRRFFPNVAAAVVTSGGATLIGLGRGAIAYPDFARDLAEKGSLSGGKVCTTCSLCSMMLRRGGPVGCGVRDREIYGPKAAGDGTVARGTATAGRRGVALILDMDGVLIDNIRFHVRAWEKFARRHGIAFDEEVFKKRFFGRTNEAILAGLFQRGFSHLEVAEYAGEKEALYRELYKNEIQPARGLTRLLEELKLRGVSLAVATAGPRANLDFALDGTSARRYFDALVDGDSVAQGKPSPDIYLKAAALLEIPPRNCAAVEDSFPGIQSAVSAGMKVIAITTTHPGDDLGGADLVIDSFEELTAHSILELVEERMPRTRRGRRTGS
ncbi:MAG TPA: HAD-IA family hydrolase [Candidatus Aminicenantes bacterium]|nr:HAD-IA family hydrolase [Candidatus Aminicenantes bacterium]